MNRENNSTTGRRTNTMHLEELLTKLVADYAGTAAKVQGLEDSVKELKGITAEALRGINEALRSNSAILEKLNSNMGEHKAIHFRIDRDEEEIKDIHSEIKSLTERMTNIELGCEAANHADLKDEVKEQEKTIQKYEKDYDIVHSNIVKTIAAALITMITLGFLADMTYHYAYIKQMLFK